MLIIYKIQSGWKKSQKVGRNVRKFHSARKENDHPECSYKQTQLHVQGLLRCLITEQKCQITAYKNKIQPQ